MQLKKDPSNLRGAKTLQEAKSPKLSQVLLSLRGLQGLVLDPGVVILGGAFTVLVYNLVDEILILLLPLLKIVGTFGFSMFSLGVILTLSLHLLY